MSPQQELYVTLYLIYTPWTQPWSPFISPGTFCLFLFELIFLSILLLDLRDSKALFNKNTMYKEYYNKKCTKISDSKYNLLRSLRMRKNSEHMEPSFVSINSIFKKGNPIRKKNIGVKLQSKQIKENIEDIYSIACTNICILICNFLIQLFNLKIYI